MVESQKKVNQNILTDKTPIIDESCKILVRVEGLEPPRPKAPEPKSGASTNSATSALYLVAMAGLEPATPAL